MKQVIDLGDRVLGGQRGCARGLKDPQMCVCCTNVRVVKLQSAVCSPVPVNLYLLYSQEIQMRLCVLDMCSALVLFEPAKGKAFCWAETLGP